MLYFADDPLNPLQGTFTFLDSFLKHCQRVKKGLMRHTFFVPHKVFFWRLLPEILFCDKIKSILLHFHIVFYFSFHSSLIIYAIVLP